MEVSLQINPKMSSLLPSFKNPKPGSKSAAHFRPNSVSCKARELSMSSNTKKANFYEVLSLGSENAGFDEIKRAYRNKARRYHPDVCPPAAKEESTRRFLELREAYETLSDPVLRRIYDYQLGLAGSFGCGVLEGFRIDEDRESRFPEAVWKKQLYELSRRSMARMARKKDMYM